MYPSGHVGTIILPAPHLVLPVVAGVVRSGIGATPDGGIRTALGRSDGRPSISAEVNGVHRDLIVDSGASLLVLFATAPSFPASKLITNSGDLETGTGSALVAIGGTIKRRLKAAEVSAPPQPGLLPAAAFKMVYISNRRGMATFVP